MKVKTRIIALGLMILMVFASFSVNAAKKNETKSSAVLDGLKGMSTVEVTSSRHTQAETNLSDQVVNHLTLDGFEKKLENEKLAIWFNPEIDGIRIVDKTNGYIWGALEEEEPEDMSTGWCNMANSLCTIEYYSGNNAEKKVSISDRKAKTKYTWKEDSMRCDVDFQKIGISFSIELNIYPDGFDIGMVEGSLEESMLVATKLDKSDAFKIKSIYFLPFLGCSREDMVDGYIFLPDGAGALMRFKKASSYQSGYEGKVYGLDMGIDTLATVNDLLSNRTNDYLVEAPQVTVPVFGFVHGVGRNGLLGVIESGDEHARIIASPSGVVTKYFWATTCFDFRQVYLHITGGTTKGILTSQDKPDNITPKIRYYLLTGEDADYSGMAVTYREYLKSKGVLSTERVDKEIPVKIDVVGAEIKKGTFFNSTKSFTTVSEAEDIVSQLKDEGISNLTFVYEGWEEGGISGAKYGETSFEEKVGTKGSMKDLRDTIVKNGGKFYLSCDPMNGNKDQFNTDTQVTMSKTNTVALARRDNPHIMYQDTFFAKVGLLNETLGKYTKKLSDFSISYKNLGYKLYADYTRNAEYSRTKAKNLITKQLKKSKNDIALSQVNEYLYPYVDDYFDIPTTGSQCLFETDTVPFLQIVLKGSIDYYSSYSNQGFNSQNSVLKMVEFGCYPSFIVAAADNFSLTGTPLEDYFSLCFDDWKGTIVEIYNQVSSALNETEGQTITSHKMLATGVARVEYSEGTVIYVNYNEQPFTVGNITVPAQGFTVERS